jgi:alpha-aminoadipic semialdehyde synthase
MRLLAISDVTCDYMGTIDFMRHFTTIEKPFFIYNPETDEIIHDVDKPKSGILYNSIENMPSEFPLDASAHFGSKLSRFVEDILKSDSSKPLKEQGLPIQIENAVITDKGKLTNKFTYIQKLREQKNKAKNMKSVVEPENFRKNSVLRNDVKKVRIFKICGHLFDRKTINKIMDYLVGRVLY